MMRLAKEAGVYTGKSLKGRGVWWIANRPVVHLGDRLILDGAERLPGCVGSAIFPRGENLEVDTNLKPMGVEEARKLHCICNRWQWRQQDGMSIMAAGLIASGLVCGALPWRTHAMVTAESGSGKTEFMRMASRVLGNLALNSMGNSTAVGLQQALKSDALCVTMDEPETQSDADAKRVAGIVSLARKASSEGGAKTRKGTQDHQGTSFLTSSMFFLAAINNPVVQAADVNRWVCLDMVVGQSEAKRADDWTATLKIMDEILTEDFGARLFLRMVEMLPVIRKNFDVLCDVIAKSVGGTARMGRTLGMPLACARALDQDGVITRAEAESLIADTAWVVDTIEELTVTPEWQQAIGRLVQHRVEVIHGDGSHEWMPLGEILSTATVATGALTADIKTALDRAGIRFDYNDGKQTVTILNQSREITSAFQRSPWSASWAKTIGRAPGATRPPGTVYIPGHTPGRGTTYPVALFAPDGIGASDG